MNKIIKPKTSIRGAFAVPGDKSVTHRAIMLNAVAEGTAVIKNALLGEDCLATIACMRELGSVITVDGSTVTVTGAKKLKNNRALYVGNSGTTIRLLAGLLAGRNINVTIDGDESIRRRPMSRVITPLNSMGARITSDGGKAPLIIKAAGGLSGIDYALPVASAQVKSAVILAGLTADGVTTVREPVATRNHTELMLENQSADISVSGNAVSVKKSVLKSLDVTVPGDISGAAFLLVYASALPGSNVLLKNIGVNPTRRAVIDVINAHGGRITLLNHRLSNGEPSADLMAESADIRPFEISGAVVPNLIDEIPALCVLAAAAKGRSVIRDARELRVKESDRIQITVDALNAMGVKASATDDGMIIDGSGVITGGCQIDSVGDHRIAMAMSVACALSVYGGEILNAESADVSYPGFFDIFE